jgi:Holliday junction DNA helicase RuvA
VIAHLRGQILTKTPNTVVLDCGGVGYELAISVATYTELPEPGTEARLHVHTEVREDALLLFGFAELAEKRLFERLLTISGIGPKLAITVLSGISADRLVGAIRSGDHATLTRIPGIGKKTAERVVLELKDKLDDMAGFTTTDGTPAPVSLGAVADYVLSALVNLGYPRPAALKAVEAAAKQLESKDWEVAAFAMDESPWKAVALDAMREPFELLFRAAMNAVK